MGRPASRTSVLSPFSVSSLAAQPPVIPEPTTIASYAVPGIFFSSGLFEICERRAAMQRTGDDFFAQFLLEAHLGRVIAGESQTLERFEEAVIQGALSFVARAEMQIPRMPLDGRGLVQIPEEILLLGLRALDKVLPKSSLLLRSTSARPSRNFLRSSSLAHSVRMRSMNSLTRTAFAPGVSVSGMIRSAISVTVAFW